MAESARSGVAPVYSHDYYKYRRHMETVEKDKEEVRRLKTLLFLAVILQELLTVVGSSIIFFVVKMVAPKRSLAGISSVISLYFR